MEGVWNSKDKGNIFHSVQTSHNTAYVNKAQQNDFEVLILLFVSGAWHSQVLGNCQGF